MTSTDSAVLQYHDIVMLQCDVEGGGYIAPSGIGECITSLALLTARTQLRIYQYREMHRFRFRILSGDEDGEASLDPRYVQRQVMFGDSVRLQHVTHGSVITVEHTSDPDTLPGVSLEPDVGPENDNRRQCFRIMPASTVRAEGNLVRHGDELLIVYEESKCTMCVIPGAVSERLGVAFHNIVMNPRRQSVFVLEVTGKINLKEKCVRVGQPLLLYNKVSLSMITHCVPDVAKVMETSTTSDPFFDAKANISKGIDPYQTFLGTVPANIADYGEVTVVTVTEINKSTNRSPHYFAFENASSSMMGGPLNNYTQYRLRHVTTNRFLTINKRFQSGGTLVKEMLEPVLTEDVGDPATCFLIRMCMTDAVVQTLDVRIAYNDLIQVENAHYKGVWLEVSDAKLVCSKVCHFEQSFEIVEPLPGQMSALAAATRTFPAICHYLHKQELPLRAMAVHAIERMIYFLIDDDEEKTPDVEEKIPDVSTRAPNENRQDVLMEANGHLLVLKLLEYFIRSKQPGIAATRGIALCYQVLTLLIKQRPMNAALLSPFIGFLVAQLEAPGIVGEKVAETILELYTDNVALLSSLKGETVRLFLEYFASKRNSRYTDIMQTLCVCKSQGYYRNQTLVLEQLFSSASPYIRRILPEMNCERDTVVIMNPFSKKQETLEEFERAGDDSIGYLAGVFELLASVSKGNQKSCKKVAELKLSAIILKILFSSKNKTLQAAALSLLVEYQISGSSDQALTVKGWSTIKKEDLTNPVVQMTLSTEDQTLFQKVKDWARSYFKEIKSMAASDNEQCMMVRAFAKALFQLVRVGLYDDLKERTELAENCLKVLDHRSDAVEAEGSEEDDFGDDIIVTSANTILVSAKIELLRILNLLLYQDALRHTNAALVSFKDQSGTAQKGYIVTQLVAAAEKPHTWLQPLVDIYPIFQNLLRFRHTAFVEEALMFLMRSTIMARYVYECLITTTILDTEYLSLSHATFHERVRDLKTCVADATTLPLQIATLLEHIVKLLSGSPEENQKLMRACNMCEPIKCILRSHWSMDDESTHSMLALCCRLIVLYCKDNSLNQRDFAPFTGALLDLAEKGAVGIGIMEAMSEVYRNNIHMLQSLDEAVVKRVVNLSLHDHVAISFLRSLVTRGSEWHQSNLGVVAKHIRLNPMVSGCLKRGTVENFLLNDGEYYALPASNSKIAYHMLLLELCSSMIHVHAAQVELDVIVGFALQPLSVLPLYYKTVVVKSLLHFLELNALSAVSETILSLLAIWSKEIHIEEAVTSAYIAQWGRYKLRLPSFEMHDDQHSDSLSIAHTASTHFYGKKITPGMGKEAHAILLETKHDDDRALGNRFMTLDRKCLIAEHAEYIWGAVVPVLTNLLLATANMTQGGAVIESLYTLCLTVLDEATVKHLERDGTVACAAAAALYQAGRKRVPYMSEVAKKMDVLSKSVSNGGGQSKVDRDFGEFCTQYFVTAATCHPMKQAKAVSTWVGSPAFTKLMKMTSHKQIEACVANKHLSPYLRQQVMLLCCTKLRENWHPSLLLLSDDAKVDFLKAIETRQNGIDELGGEKRMCHVAFELMSSPELRYCALELLIGLLNKGNRALQKSVLEFSRSESGAILMVIRKQLQAANTMMYSLDTDIQETKRPESVVQLKLVCYSTCRLLRFLQLLTEGHNASLQNALRIQPEKKNSVNIVKDVVNLFIMWVEYISEDNMSVGIQSLKSLTEFCQGPCQDNQLELVENGIAAILGKIILGKVNRYASLMESAPMKVHELTTECVTLLLALTEGLTTTSPVPAGLFTAIPTEELIDRSNECWVLGNIVSKYLNVSQFTGKNIETVEEAAQPSSETLNIEEAILTLTSHAGGPLEAQFMLQSELCPESVLQDEDDDQEQYPTVTRIGISLFMYLLAMSRFRKELRVQLENQMSYLWYFERVGVIEINRVDLSRTERVIFPIPLRCKYLVENSKDIFTDEVDRASISTKLNFLMDNYDDLIEETNIYSDVAKSWFVGIFVSHAFKIEMSSLATATVISLFLIATMSKENSETTFFLSPTQFPIFQALALCQLCQEFWMFLGWMSLHGQVHFKKSISLEIRRRKRRIQFGEDNEEVNADLRRWLTFRKKPLWWQAEKGFQMFATYEAFWVQVLFASAAPLGLAWNPIFFSIQIFRVVKYSVALQNVVSAVTLRASELIQAALFGSLIIFLFAVISFLEFPDKFYDQFANADGGTGFNCDKLSQCFLVILVYGIRTDGGIGMRLSAPNWNNAGQAWVRLIYEFLFWMILVVIFLNIIFGIILDTFAELRDRRQERLRDMVTRCFICGIESHEFDKVQGHSFHKHYKEEHNQWDYVKFFHHLQLKQQTEYTGQESYVSDRLKRKDTSFLPVAKSIALEHLDKETADENRDVQIVTNLRTVERIYEAHLSELNMREKQRQATALLETMGKEGGEDMNSIVEGSRPGSATDSVVPYSDFNNRGKNGDDDQTTNDAWVTEEDSDQPFANEEQEGFLSDEMRAKMMKELSALISRNHERAKTVFKRK